MKTLNELRRKAQIEREELRAGKISISVDTGHLGAAAGSLAIAEHFVAEAARLGVDLRVTSMGSFGWREIEPLVAIALPGEQRIYFANVTQALASELLAGLAGDGDLRPDLALAADGKDFAGLPALASLPFFGGQRRVALRHVGKTDPEDFNDALVSGAYASLEKALALAPDALIECVERAGLRARGSQALLAAKWRECRSVAAAQHYVVADAACGFDRFGPYDLLLEGDPHAVLEGILMAAYAVGANQAYLCIDPGSTVAISRVNLALKELQAAQLIGENILGSGFNCEIELRMVTRRLAAAEDSILIAAFEGRQPAQVRPRPPAPESEGLFAQPTTVQDVESLVLVAALLAEGTVSPEASPQTMIVQLDGSLARTGFVEVPLGTPLGTIVEQIGGGAATESGLKALQIGSPAGGFVPAAALDLAFDYEELRKAGCALVSGYLFAVPGDACAVDLARQAAAAVQRASCGKCTFGREGTRQLKDVTSDLARGRGLAADLDLLFTIADGMKGGSLCPNGRNAPDAVLTTLRLFRDEYEAHLHARHCPANICAMATQAVNEKVAQ